MGGYADALAGVATHVGHELLAHGADLFGEGGREHHHLLVVWGHFEDGLNVRPHICSSKNKKIQQRAADSGQVMIVQMSHTWQSRKNSSEGSSVL